MSEVNFKDTIINITLGDIVQQFTESELQKQMPIFMQDIDAETKELVDTYQSYISAGNFAEAETYRAANPVLETRIWDAFKANSLLAYVAYVYLYAQNQHQQCYFSDTEPSLFNETTGIGAVNGDIWFQYTTKTVISDEGKKTKSIDYSIPFNTYVLQNETWEKFVVTPELDIATESDINEVYNDEVAELTNPDYLIDEKGLKGFKEKLSSDYGSKISALQDLLNEYSENITQLTAKILSYEKRLEKIETITKTETISQSGDFKATINNWMGGSKLIVFDPPFNNIPTVTASTSRSDLKASIHDIKTDSCVISWSSGTASGGTWTISWIASALKYAQNE